MIEQIQRCIDEIAFSGTPVTFSIHGAVVQPSANIRILCERITREAIVNAMKHSPGGLISIGLGFQDTIRLSIRCEAPVRRQRIVDVPSGGHGLALLEKEVEAFGGRFHAQRAGLTFEVCAQLPLPCDRRSASNVREVEKDVRHSGGNRGRRASGTRGLTRDLQ